MHSHYPQKGPLLYIRIHLHVLFPLPNVLSVTQIIYKVRRVEKRTKPLFTTSCVPGIVPSALHSFFNLLLTRPLEVGTTSYVPTQDYVHFKLKKLSFRELERFVKVI